MGDLVPTLVGGLLTIAGGFIGGVFTVKYQFERMQDARRQERQDAALLELAELLIPIEVALARTLPQERPYHVPPVMDLEVMGTHEVDVEDVEGPEMWDGIARRLHDVEKQWRSRLRLSIRDPEVSDLYGKLRRQGFELARRDNASTRGTAQSIADLLAQLRALIESRYGTPRRSRKLGCG